MDGAYDVCDALSESIDDDRRRNAGNTPSATAAGSPRRRRRHLHERRVRARVDDLLEQAPRWHVSALRDDVEGRPGARMGVAVRPTQQHVCLRLVVRHAHHGLGTGGTARRGIPEAREHARDGGLANTVAPCDEQVLAAPYGEGQIFHQRRLAAVRK